MNTSCHGYSRPHTRYISTMSMRTNYQLKSKCLASSELLNNSDNSGTTAVVFHTRHTTYSYYTVTHMYRKLRIPKSNYPWQYTQGERK